jgi:hypothetical protein
METIGIDISKDKTLKVVYIKAKTKRDFYEQVKKYNNWRLFAWYYRHKWFR